MYATFGRVNNSTYAAEIVKTSVVAAAAAAAACTFLHLFRFILGRTKRPLALLLLLLHACIENCETPEKLL